MKDHPAPGLRPEFRLLGDAFDATPIGILLAELEGRLLFANQALCSMLGFSEGEIRGMNWTELSPPEDAARDEALFGQLRAGSIDHYHLERRCFRRDESFLAAHWSVWVLRNAASPVVLAMITDKGQAELALRESEEHFRNLANTVPAMIWTSEEPGRLCTYTNERWLQFTGRSLREQLGSGWAAGVHPEDLERWLEMYTKSFHRREPFQMEYRLRRHDGEYRWVLDQGIPRFNPDKSFAGYIGSAIDVTERKHAEEALSGLSQRLIETQEEERARIARELHDDISQRIAVLAFNLVRLEHHLPSSAAELTQEFEAARKQVEELGSDVRALSHRLHSSKLKLLGLEAAAAGFCSELSDLLGLKIDFHAERIPKELPEDISLCIFRVLQEALQNAAKHSGSQRFQVLIMLEASEICLTVHDSGVGFQPQEAIRGRGIGLLSMQERLKLVKGKLSVDSSPQRGTTIQARVPVPVHSSD
jgi:PAS domain S-box-containing protein